MNQKHVFGYTCVSNIIAIWILIYGCIPKPVLESKLADKNDLPDTIDNVKIMPQTLYYSHIEKLVIFIIDEFRVKDLNDGNFPYVSNLIRRQNASFLIYKIQPISTTLQKIKTLMSGFSTGFLDNILSSKGSKFQADNILRLAKENNLHISSNDFKTWLKLFPNSINEEKLEDIKNFADSYFTKDYWDWFIFYYQASKAFEFQYTSQNSTKLNNLLYLDEIIKSIHTILSNQEKIYTILVIGDSDTKYLKHLNELKKDTSILAPCIVIQNDLYLLYRQKKSMNEFDIAPMISVLTGLPIPSSSYGSIHLNLLLNFTLDEKMYASYYNTKKLMGDLIKLGTTINYADYMCPNFLQTATYHGEYLRNSEKNETASNKILQSYENLMDCLSQVINEVRKQSNISVQFLALILLIENLTIILNVPNKNSNNINQNIIFALGFHVCLIVFIMGLGVCKRVTSFASMSQKEATIITIIGIIMTFNSYILVMQDSFISKTCSVLITKLKRSKEILESLSSKSDVMIPSICTNKNSIFIVLMFGTILQSLSLLEFSFVKSEKWTWFFLWTSACFWIITKKFQKLYSNAFSTDKVKQAKFVDYQSQISIIISILVTHRIILSYTEIEHWLQYSPNPLFPSLSLFFGLMILVFVCSIYYKPFSNKCEKFIIFVQLIFTVCAIFVLRVAEGKATFFYYPSTSTGLIETILFWFGYCFGLVYGLIISIMKTCFAGKSSAKKLLASGITCCSLFMASQDSISHVLLISMQILYSLAFADILKNHKSSFILSHSWLGHLFFHYQINYIPNLDDIQKTVDILFSMDYCFITRGLITTLNKFSAPILAYFLCIHGQLNNNPKLRASENMLRVNKTFMSCQLMIIISYTLGIMFQSPSEWPWNFLCMKLLYEIVHIVLLIIVSLCIQTVISVHDFTLAPAYSSRIR